MLLKNSTVKILFFMALCISFANAAVFKANFRDKLGNLRQVFYEKYMDYALVEGDIIISKLDILKNKSASILLPALGGDRWSNNVVPYIIADDLPAMNRLAVLQAISIVQKETNIKFIALDSFDENTYPNYVVFVPGGGTTCASFVGRQRGRQVIILAPRCNAMNTVHEIGHALGLWHEQSRTDRDLYVRIIWSNIQEDHKYNFNQHLTDGQDYGDYDYESIMHYPEDAFSKNGEKTIIPLQVGVQIGQRDHLSIKDIIAINAMYPTRL